MSRFFRSCSSKFGGDHALEGEEYVEKGNKLVKWEMPKVPTSKIYEKTTKFFPLFSSPDRSIRTSEGKISFGNGAAAFQLLDETPSPFGGIGEFYNTMNIGLVQLGVKTLTRKIPSNASIILCIRDNRVEKVPDCLLALVKSNLGDGPFYFNVFPNMNLSLSSSAPDYMPPSVLTVHVLINGFEHLPEGSQPIVLSCRTCYKLNTDNFGPEALIESPVGKNVFFQTQIRESNDVVQKVTNWEHVQLPPNWPPKLQKTNIPKLVYGSDGSVRVVFE